MPGVVPCVPVLADAEGITAAIVMLVTIIGWIANLVSNKNQKGPPVANRPRAPVRPRDERLQQEISIFMEQAGQKPSKPVPARPAVPPARPSGAGARQPPTRTKPPAPVKRPARQPRPGGEIASRQAPVTESLGTGVRRHLSQHLSERVAHDVQQRLVPRVEEKVATDPGAPTGGPAPRALLPQAAAPATVPGRAERLAEMLRSPANVQQAIVLNLILSKPPARTRSSGR